MSRATLERKDDVATQQWTDQEPTNTVPRGGSRPRWTMAALAVPVTMIGSLLWGIWHWSSAVPLEDEWLWALLLDRAKGNTLPWGDLWATHNGHRIFVPTLIDLILVKSTHWNRQVLMTFNLGVMVLVALMLVWCVWRTTRSLRATLGLIIPLSLLLFTWGSYESWFQPFQFVAFLAVFGLACCLVAWAPRRDGRAGGWGTLALALCGAIVATFSFATGLMLWLTFLPSAVAAGWRKALVWVAVALGAWALYFRDFNQVGLLSAQQPVGATKLPAPGALAAYVLTYLGAPLGFPDRGHALFFGAAGLALALVSVLALSLRRDGWRDSLIWLELALFALLVAGETAYARLNAGMGEAISSRYEVWSTLWWVALSMLSALSLRAWRPAEAIPTWRVLRGDVLARVYGALQLAALVAMCAAVLGVNLIGVVYTQMFVLPQQWHQDCALHYQQAPASCAQYYTDAGPLAFQTWSALLRRDDNAIFATGALGRYPATRASLALVRYYNPTTMEHWVTTDYFAPIGPDHIAAPAGYRPDSLIGYLYDAALPETAPLYSCLAWSTDHFISRQPDCEGQQQLGIQGWMYNAPPKGISARPLYRCLVGLNHYASTHPDCEGYLVEGLLGWVLAAP